MTENPDDFIVPGHQPEAEAGVPVDGVGVAEVAEAAVGVGDDLGGEEIVGERDAGGRAHQVPPPTSAVASAAKIAGPFGEVLTFIHGT